jgi:hypothetical protein
LLKDKGITDILSIQTPQDYHSHNLSEDFLRKLCQIQGISYHSSDIADKNPRDFVKKALITFEKMETILKK